MQQKSLQERRNNKLTKKNYHYEKDFLALMAIAAIALTGCKDKQEPKEPQDPQPQERQIDPDGKAAMTLCFYTTDTVAMCMDFKSDANNKGLSVHTHAMGDGAVHRCVVAYSLKGKPELRNSICHLRNTKVLKTFFEGKEVYSK